jgi:hypothetical protein
MLFRLLAVLVVFGLGPASADPSFWRHEWPNTDFSVTSVASWTEIKSGGPPKDGIPRYSTRNSSRPGRKPPSTGANRWLPLR